MNDLNVTEAGRLAELETIIEQGLTTFIEVGNALLEIRDTHLYRRQYATFEEYCQQRWDLRRSRAYQLMAAAEVVENLKMSTIVDIPANEAQVRSLARLAPDQQRQVWEQAVSTAPNGRLTARHVEQTARQLAEPESSPTFHAENPVQSNFTCPRCRQRTIRVNGGAMCLNDGCRARWTVRADYEAEAKSLGQDSLVVNFAGIPTQEIERDIAALEAAGYSGSPAVERMRQEVVYRSRQESPGGAMEKYVPGRLDKNRRGILKSVFAQAVNNLTEDQYREFDDRLRKLLKEFDVSF